MQDLRQSIWWTVSEPSGLSKPLVTGISPCQCALIRNLQNHGPGWPKGTKNKPGSLVLLRTSSLLSDFHISPKLVALSTRHHLHPCISCSVRNHTHSWHVCILFFYSNYKNSKINLVWLLELRSGHNNNNGLIGVYFKHAHCLTNGHHNQSGTTSKVWSRFCEDPRWIDWAFRWRGYASRRGGMVPQCTRLSPSLILGLTVKKN